MQNLVYLDNGAATRMDERVLEAMKPYLFDIYAVATSDFAYTMGIEAREALDGARERISAKLKTSPNEVIFTSGSTESSNLAIKGVVKKCSREKKHLVVSQVEDFPVLHSAQALEREGFRVTYLGVDSEGLIDLEGLKEAISSDTFLVSIQHGNQEIGTVQDIRAIAEICEDAGCLFHTDATHTFTRVPLDLSEIGVNLATVSAHTIHGPKGVGALFVREGTPIQKIMDGGFQEFNLRPGVENIAGAVGFAEAAGLVTAEENERLKSMRDRLITRVLNEIPDTTLNGHPYSRTPQNANVTFHFVEGESITLHMDMRGFAVSTGSACFSRSLEASHVIMAIGGDHERAHGSVRFVFGRYNTMEEVDATVENISEVVARLREISPLSKKGKRWNR